MTTFQPTFFIISKYTNSASVIAIPHYRGIDALLLAYI